MSKSLMDRPGLVIFRSGVATLVASVVLGLFLSNEASARLAHLDPHPYMLHDSSAETAEIKANLLYMSNVNALMWMVLGIGVTLTWVGLRMMTRPKLDCDPSPPIGSIRDLFEKSD